MSEAVFGLAGVVVGAFLAWARESWSERVARKRRARYLAMRVLCVLDEYVIRCTEVAIDSGQRNEDGYLQTRIALPPPPSYPPDVDWNSIDHELMYRLLSLPSRAEAASRIVAAVSDDAFPPDYDEVYEERHFQYAKLGLAANALARGVRQTYGISSEESVDWNPIEYLERAKADVEESRRRRRERFNELVPVSEATEGHAVS